MRALAKAVLRKRAFHDRQKKRQAQAMCTHHTKYTAEGGCAQTAIAVGRPVCIVCSKMNLNAFQTHHRHMPNPSGTCSTHFNLKAGQKKSWSFSRVARRNPSSSLLRGSHGEDVFPTGRRCPFSLQKNMLQHLRYNLLKVLVCVEPSPITS